MPSAFHIIEIIYYLLSSAILHFRRGIQSLSIFGTFWSSPYFSLEFLCIFDDQSINLEGLCVFRSQPNWHSCQPSFSWSGDYRALFVFLVCRLGCSSLPRIFSCTRTVLGISSTMSKLHSAVLLLAATVGVLITTHSETRAQWLNSAVVVVEETLLNYDLTVTQMVYWASLTTLVYFALTFVYDMLFAPLRRVRHLEDVGYVNHDNKNPLSLSNDMRKRRVRGTVPPPFPNGWYCLAYSREILEKGVKNVEALGQHFAVFRGEDGKAHILDAYCPHLGANLACGGKVKGSSLQCPFHGWEFRGDDGECVNIPYTTTIPSHAKTKAWTTMEINGQILVWYDAEGRDPLWEPPAIHGIENKTWTTRGYTQHTINAHIQEVPENGADVPHLNFLHSPVIAVGNDLRKTQTGTGPSMRWIQV